MCLTALAWNACVTKNTQQQQHQQQNRKEKELPNNMYLKIEFRETKHRRHIDLICRCVRQMRTNIQRRPMQRRRQLVSDFWYQNER